MLEHQRTSVSTAFDQVYRHVILKSLCAVATAFELGPSRQDATTYASLARLITLTMAGEWLVHAHAHSETVSRACHCVILRERCYGNGLGASSVIVPS